MSDLSIPNDYKNTQSDLYLAITSNQTTVCMHPGSDVEHFIEKKRNFWLVTTRNSCGVLRVHSYQDPKLIEMDLAGSVIYENNLQRAANA